jgi:hypothetical protein
MLCWIGMKLWLRNGKTPAGPQAELPVGTVRGVITDRICRIPNDVALARCNPDLRPQARPRVLHELGVSSETCVLLFAGPRRSGAKEKPLVRVLGRIERQPKPLALPVCSCCIAKQPEDIAHQMMMFPDNPRPRRAMAKVARKTVERFSWDPVGERSLQLIYEVARTKQAGDAPC